MLNKNELIKLLNTNETGRGVFLSLSSRKRHTSTINTNGMKLVFIREGIRMAESEYNSFWTGLVSVGVGELAKNGVFRPYYRFDKLAAELTGPSHNKVEVKKAGEAIRKAVKKANNTFNRSETMKAVWAKRRATQSTAFLHIPEIADKKIFIPTNLTATESRALIDAIEQGLAKAQ